MAAFSGEATSEFVRAEHTTVRLDCEQSLGDLAHVADGGRFTALGEDSLASHEGKRGENGDDHNHHHEFNEREAVAGQILGWFALHIVDNKKNFALRNLIFHPVL